MPYRHLPPPTATYPHLRRLVTPAPLGSNVIQSIPLIIHKKGSAHEPEAFKLKEQPLGWVIYLAIADTSPNTFWRIGVWKSYVLLSEKRALERP